MNRYKHFDDEGLSLFLKILIILFVVGYPLFVSMYMMLPPFIGLVGYILILNFDKEKIYVFGSLFYLLNLDLNLSLPLFLSIFMIMLIYMFVYTPLKRLVRCKICLLFTLIMIIDFSYYFSLFLYDFIFNTNTVLADMLLVYYIAIDMFIGVVL